MDYPYITLRIIHLKRKLKHLDNDVSYHLHRQQVLQIRAGILTFNFKFPWNFLNMVLHIQYKLCLVFVVDVWHISAKFSSVGRRKLSMSQLLSTADNCQALEVQGSNFYIGLTEPSATAFPSQTGNKVRINVEHWWHVNWNRKLLLTPLNGRCTLDEMLKSISRLS